jgi:hypothetical protein
MTDDEHRRNQKREWDRSHKEQLHMSHRKYYMANKDEIRARQRAWYLANKEKCSARSKANYLEHREERRIQGSAYARAHPEVFKRSRERYLKSHTYEVLVQTLTRHAEVGGFAPPIISRETFDRLSLVKNCQICGVAENGKKLAFDHDHETGQIRGRICSTCNLALGQMGSPDILRKAADYLEGGGVR